MTPVRVSESKTDSTLKEEKYDSRFFSNLTAGEFVGIAPNANVKDFHLCFYVSFRQGKRNGITHRSSRDTAGYRKNYDKIIDDVGKI